MTRIHAPELEDEAWFPTPLRDALTAFLQVCAEKLDTFQGAGPVLAEVVARHQAERIIDLCSGGGGPLLSLLSRDTSQKGRRKSRRRGTSCLGFVDATLTDLYPNLGAFELAEERLPSRVRGERMSVDATNVPARLSGVRTIFNAFHHFRPDSARRILEDAAKKKQPLCIFEVVERHPACLLSVAFVPLALLVLTPWTRATPLRLLLTYLIPLIPLLALWDGLASMLRAYSLDELRALAASVQVEGYTFRVGRTPRSLVPVRVTYLIGEPIEDALGAAPTMDEARASVA